MKVEERGTQQGASTQNSQTVGEARGLSHLVYVMLLVVSNIIGCVATVIVVLWLHSESIYELSWVKSMADGTTQASLRRDLQEPQTCCNCLQLATLAPTPAVEGDCNLLEDEDGNAINDDNFTTFALIDLVGRPRDLTPTELALLEQTFLDSYNPFGAPFCREVLEAQIVDAAEEQGRRKLQAPRPNTVTKPFTTFFKLKWRCRKCPKGEKLFTNDAGRRRSLQDEGDFEFCADCGGPLESQFLTAYNASIQVLAQDQRLVSVDVVVEVSQLQEEPTCAQEAQLLDVQVEVPFVTDPTQVSPDNFGAIQEAFKQTYNALNVLNGDTCDPLFREVVSVSISETTTDSIVFDVNFRCRGCVAGTGIFAVGDETIRRSLLSFTTIHTNSERALQTVQQDCLCAPDAMNTRAPTFLEFQVAYAESVRILVVQDDVDVDAQVETGLTLSKRTILQGETVSVTVAGEAGAADDVKLFRSDVTNFNSAPVWIDRICGCANGNYNFRGLWAGSFRLVLFTSHSNIILGVSGSFTVLPSPGFLAMDKSSYLLGEVPSVTFTGETSQLSAIDDVKLFRSEVTDFNTGPVWFDRICSCKDGQYNGFRGQWAGSFRLVHMIHGTNVALGVSDTFTVLPSPGFLATEKLSYLLGEVVSVTFEGGDLSQLSNLDEVKVFRSEVTDFSTAPVRFDRSCSCKDGHYNLRTFGVGSFILVIMVDKTNIVLGVSDSFTVLPSPGFLATDKSSYLSGEVVSVTFEGGDLSQLSSLDDMKLFRSEVTDFSTDEPVWVDSNCFCKDGNYDFRALGAGSFRLVLVIHKTKVAFGMSDSFTVLP